MDCTGTDSSSELLSMHFIESLRNVLHVLQTSGIFLQASKRSGQVRMHENSLLLSKCGIMSPSSPLHPQTLIELGNERVYSSKNCKKREFTGEILRRSDLLFKKAHSQKTHSKATLSTRGQGVNPRSFKPNAVRSYCAIRENRPPKCSCKTGQIWPLDPVLSVPK